MKNETDHWQQNQNLQKGDSYHIPEGVVHSAESLTDLRAIDFFIEPDRYKEL
jgi:quercetin dioxygenase-like cupin family protein